MVRPALRSRSHRKVTRKVPGGRSKVQYKAKKPTLGVCSVTGQKLKGTARVSSSKLRSSAHTKKSPSRPYGGVLSSKAMRVLMKNKARTK